MGVADMKEGVGDKLKKEVGNLWRTQVIPRINTRRKAAVTFVVVAFGIVTTWMGIDGSFQSNRNTSDVKDLKGEAAEFRKFREEVCAELVPAQLRKKFHCPEQKQAESNVPVAPLPKPAAVR